MFWGRYARLKTRKVHTGKNVLNILQVLKSILKYINEIQGWWLQAKNDLEKAEILMEHEKFDGATFFCYQAIEKALKAYILFRTRDRFAEGHSLIHLSKIAKLPDSFSRGLKMLSPQYFISRYPDVTEDAPYELYDAQSSVEYLETARGVIELIGRRLK